jgi:hypothetical protein
MAGLTYYDATKVAVSDPIGALGSAIAGFFTNGVYGVAGYVSPWNKDYLSVSEALDNFNASAGTLSQEAAMAQATTDITNSLMASGADPSQAPNLISQFGNIINILIVAGFLIVAIQLLSLLRRL